LPSIAKDALADRLEHILQHGVEVEILVVVCMTEIFDVLAEVAEEEDVLLADLSGDLYNAC
jgi:hypothetical protein